MAFDGPFPIQPEVAIASYDFFDIAEGTGIKLFNGLAVADNSSIAPHTSQVVKYILSSTNIGSDGVNIFKSGTTTEDDLAFDIDLDLTQFNAPRDIQGTANITVNGTMTAGDPATNHSACFEFILSKWDGTTETPIGTGFSNPGGTVTSGTNTFFLTTPISIAAVNNFKIGDILRLTVKAYTRSSLSTNGGTVKLFLNPVTADEELKLWIPFKIQT